ncbi:MAG: SDR family NAD(P)-dependent oxidoreductase [Bacteroidales bacterium]|nr:SDR family NAD(P)-dependent oxidoreductase [Bacteroidales bacterium]
MKKAIIVGGSSGIGEQVALLLLQEGYNIGLAARRLERLKEIQNKYGAERVKIIDLDVQKQDADKKLETLINLLGGMDLYFHASGIGTQNIDLVPEIEIETSKTNCEGFIRLVTFAFNWFYQNKIKGHIAVISSIAGTKGLGVAPAYSATKAMQNTYIQSLCQLSKIKKADITFTDIRPGFVATELLNKNKHYPMLMKKEKVAKIIIKALKRKKRILIIDWKFHLVVILWRMIPSCIWERIVVKN